MNIVPKSKLPGGRPREPKPPDGRAIMQGGQWEKKLHEPGARPRSGSKDRAHQIRGWHRNHSREIDELWRGGVLGEGTGFTGWAPFEKKGGRWGEERRARGAGVGGKGTH